MGVPGLEEHFLEPPGWRWDYFTNEGRTLRYGSVSPAKPDAVVVGLQGLSEFAEKYFETARNCLERNLAFYALDWMSQGKSGRYIEGSQKRHSLGYEHDLSDLHAFITNHVKTDAPLVLLAHSMGAHIGMRYMAEHPDVFQCAALSAPMLGLKAFELTPPKLALLTTKTANSFFSTSYAPGFSDWREEIRSTPLLNFFSGDKVRNEIHNAWCLADPALQIGGITYGWLHETQKSCMALWKKGVLQSIRIPCLLAMAGHEHFVSNSAIRTAADIMPRAKLLEFPGSRHEILMEKDSIRNVFLDAFYELIRIGKQG